MELVKAKKHLGQHFLKDLNIAQKIADTLSLANYKKVVEIGAGMGVLTQFLLKKDTEVYVVEIDKESVAYLDAHYPELRGKIIADDFLKYDIAGYLREPFAIIGNFPYNISTQIVFKLSKTYGILSVLVQAFYEATYLFTVSEGVFNPPPKVKSGVLRLVRKPNYHLDCDEALFFTIVKTAFNQRRKTLRNSLKPLLTNESLKKNSIFDKRPEQLPWQDFVFITKEISRKEQ